MTETTPLAECAPAYEDPRAVAVIANYESVLRMERQKIERLHDEVDRLRFGAADLATAWRRQAVGVAGFMPASGQALLKCADELERTMSQDHVNA